MSYSESLSLNASMMASRSLDCFCVTPMASLRFTPLSLGPHQSDGTAVITVGENKVVNHKESFHNPKTILLHITKIVNCIRRYRFASKEEQLIYNGGYSVGKCRAKKKPCPSSRCPDNQLTASMLPPEMNKPEKAKDTKPSQSKNASQEKPNTAEVVPLQSAAKSLPGSAAEKRGLEYIKNLLPKGWKIDSTGKNSKLSDLEITDSKGRSKGYIEVKQLPSAAGGQIVISISGNVITSNNKNMHTPAVLEILEKHEKSKDAQYQKIPLTPENEEVVWDWMLTHWQSKHVIAFYLTDKEQTYEKFVEVNKIKDEASVVLSKRKKPSGSSELPKKDYIEVSKYFLSLKSEKKLNIVEHDNRIFVKSSSPLESSELYHKVNGISIYLSADSSKCKDGEYEIKKPSVTNHMTIMMSLRLKGRAQSTPTKETQDFFKKIA